MNIKELAFEAYKEAILENTGRMPETIREDFEEWWKEQRT